MEIFDKTIYFMPVYLQRPNAKVKRCFYESIQQTIISCQTFVDNNCTIKDNNTNDNNSKVSET